MIFDNVCIGLPDLIIFQLIPFFRQKEVGIKNGVVRLPVFGSDSLNSVINPNSSLNNDKNDPA